MKKLLIIGLLFLMGCHERTPDGPRAQTVAEKFLDTLYRPEKVENIKSVNFIGLKDYSDPTKQKAFQQNNNYYHLSGNEWAGFTKKVNAIVSQRESNTEGIMTIESYQVNGVKYATAFFVDGAFKKVFAAIQLK